MKSKLISFLNLFFHSVIIFFTFFNIIFLLDKMNFQIPQQYYNNQYQFQINPCFKQFLEYNEITDVFELKPQKRPYEQFDWSNVEILINTIKNLNLEIEKLKNEKEKNEKYFSDLNETLDKNSNQFFENAEENGKMVKKCKFCQISGTN